MKSAILIAFIALSASGQTCPMAADGSAQHGADVDHRHDMLGVSHTSTQHTFRSLDDGAAIELRATDATDKPTIEAVRKHIRTVADQFKTNDFSTPMFVHGKTPDGVETIKKLHDSIEFRYEELPAGARIRMSTSNAEAIAALHAFMHFQTVEHHVTPQ